MRHKALLGFLLAAWPRRRERRRRRTASPDSGPGRQSEGDRRRRPERALARTGRGHPGARRHAPCCSRIPSRRPSTTGNDDNNPNLIPALGSNVEASKTEPDKNTYLVLKGQGGSDLSSDCGTHFGFQGHEAVMGGQGYITRINLDADIAHRVTLMATTDIHGAPCRTSTVPPGTRGRNAFCSPPSSGTGAACGRRRYHAAAHAHEI
jgi:hypothetical protein